jgi:hypothetical protein
MQMFLYALKAPESKDSIVKQTSEAIQGNASHGDSNITKEAKNIGKNITEVAKKIR